MITITGELERIVYEHLKKTNANCDTDCLCGEMIDFIAELKLRDEKESVLVCPTKYHKMLKKIKTSPFCAECGSDLR